MASKSIDVRLRLQGANKFQREAGSSAKSIDRIGGSTRVTGRHFDETSKKSERARRGFRALGTAAKYGALAIGAGLVVEAKRSVLAFDESRRVTADTAAVIKSTGGVANVTSGQIAGLSEAISLKSGVDDEAIQKSQNLLLTFRNIRNETGKNNDIFNRAADATSDLAARFDKGLNPSAIMLGKAVNDPIKGITALTRTGIQFTEQQKDQITAMVESGNVLGAQKKILKEVEIQTKGAAAANRTPFEALSVSIENLEEKIGGALFPTLRKGADSLSRFVNQIVKGRGAGGRFANTVRNLWKSAKPVVVWFGRAAKNIAEFGAEHPKVTKVAVALALAAGTFKLFKIGAALAQIGRLRTALGLLKTFMGRVGTDGGSLLARNTATTASTGVQTSARSGRLRSGFRSAGKLAGAAFGAYAAIQIADAVADALVKSDNDLLRGVGEAGGGGDPETSLVPRPGAGALRDLLGFSAGGLISRAGGGSIVPRGDDTVTGAQYGEFMVRRGVVNRFGSAAFDRLNQTGDASGFGGAGGDIVIHNRFEVDGRVLAETTERVKRAKRARA
jgi:acid phosphatase family membrane protein YuiD